MKQDNDVFFSQYSTRNSVKITNAAGEAVAQVIISVEPLLTLGDTGDIPYSQNSAVAIFAENIKFSSALKASKAIIAAHSIDFPNSSQITFDFAGANGTDSDMPPPAGQSHDGQNGHNLFLYTESNPASGIFKIKSNGGQGGTGKVGADGVIGKAGNGGNGGKVEFYSSSIYSKAIDDISAFIASSSSSPPKQMISEQMILEIKDMISSYGTSDIKKYFNDLNNLVAGENVQMDFLNFELETIRYNINSVLASYKESQKANIDVSLGSGGPSVDDKRGMNGREGYKKLEMKGSVKTLQLSIGESQLDFALPVHPAQCAMLLNTVKLKYMLLNTNYQAEGGFDLFQQEVLDIRTLLHRLVDRTKAFADLPKDSGLYKLYAEHEQDIGAHDSVSSLTSIYNQSRAHLYNLEHSLDFFGQPNSYVPILQMKDLQTELEKMLGIFSTVENQYIEYLRNLKDQKLSVDLIKSLRKNLKDRQGTIKNDIDFLIDNLRQTGSSIDPYTEILESHRARVTNLLTSFRNDIPKFDFDISNLLDAASMIAFAPDNPLMWGTQGAKIEYQGFTEIKNDQGIPVNRNYLIRQVENVDADLKTISEEYKVSDDGAIALADPGARKLLVDQATLSSQLDSFYNKFPGTVEDLKNAIQQYVSLVIERNNIVVKYNAVLGMLQGKYQEQKDNANKLASLTDQFLDQVNPDLPSLTAFALESYNAVQNDVVYLMNLASRVHRLWTLENQNLCTIRDGSGNPPVQLNFNTLNDVYEKFYITNIISAIKGQPIMTGAFTASNTTASYAFSCDDYFGDLRYGVIFSLEPQLQGQPGPFGEMSAVRISEVRVYLKDAKLYQGHEHEDIVIDITHGQNDTFITHNNMQVTFSYDRSKNMPFHYHVPTTESFNEIPITTSKISADADFRIPSIEDDSEKYAVISPFTDWTVTVDAGVNPNLDYESITGVIFEFYGFSSGFDR
jgi:hypothetical protein